MLRPQNASTTTTLQHPHTLTSNHTLTPSPRTASSPHLTSPLHLTSPYLTLPYLEPQPQLRIFELRLPSHSIRIPRKLDLSQRSLDKPARKYLAWEVRCQLGTEVAPAGRQPRNRASDRYVSSFTRGPISPRSCEVTTSPTPRFAAPHQSKPLTNHHLRVNGLVKHT